MRRIRQAVLVRGDREQVQVERRVGLERRIDAHHAGNGVSVARRGAKSRARRPKPARHVEPGHVRSGLAVRGTAPDEHGGVRIDRAPELEQQAALAQPRLARDRHDAPASLAGVFARLDQRGQLRVAPVKAVSAAEASCSRRSAVAASRITRSGANADSSLGSDTVFAARRSKSGATARPRIGRDQDFIGAGVGAQVRRTCDRPAGDAIRARSRRPFAGPQRHRCRSRCATPARARPVCVSTPLAHQAAQLDRRADGTGTVILQARRNAEEQDDAVFAELVDRAAMPFDDLERVLLEPAQEHLRPRVAASVRRARRIRTARTRRPLRAAVRRRAALARCRSPRAGDRRPHNPRVSVAPPSPAGGRPSTRAAHRASVRARARWGADRPDAWPAPR